MPIIGDLMNPQKIDLKKIPKIDLKKV